MRLTALFLTASLAAGSCGSSPPTRFYVLSPMEPGQVTDTGDARLAIRIARIEMPRYVAGPEIVTRLTETHIEPATFDLWAEPIEKGVTRTLRTNLSLLLPKADVVVEPFESPTPDHHLFVFVERFDVDQNDTARLVARWGLTGPEPDAGFALRDVQIQRPCDGKDYDARVRALSATVGDLAREIADVVRGEAAGDGGS